MNESIRDTVLIGGGIMSATLATLLHRLEPDWAIEVFERLSDVGREASDSWNNAGTGHAGLCELNYTPERDDGSIDVARAIEINEQFQVGRRWWTHLATEGILQPDSFIRPVPHMTFVRGAADIDYLRRRHAALSSHPSFAAMRFSDDPATIGGWAPLLVDERAPGEPIAATYDPTGTDVDFGALTRQLFAYLAADGVRIGCNRPVRGLRQEPDSSWRMRVGGRGIVRARFVFVGAGGRTLTLLQRAGIPEVRGYGLLPVSGRFLRCDNPEVVARHDAKVYGKAPVGAPPIAMPHLDTRVIDGRRSILFGPYAGSSPKFLKYGSLLDFPASLRPHNLRPLAAMAHDNLALVRLMTRELTATRARKLAVLREFAPSADAADWTMIEAGQRAQIVAPDGTLRFGTEVVAAADGSIAGVLGASPGASTAVPIMLDLLARCFPHLPAPVDHEQSARIVARNRTLCS